MKIDIAYNKKEHLNRSWKVHKITTDFELWDVWNVPIKADNSKNENFELFYAIAMNAFILMESKRSITSFLLKFRFLLGKIIPFDKNINTLPIPGCNEISIKSRLTEQELKQNRAGKRIKSKEIGLDFPPVYLFEKESLHELSNNTVHALIHFGWIKVADYYTASLAIYIKSRGLTGQFYLKLIEPFRRIIVYPTLMKTIKKEWQKSVIG